jgi:DNA polymerase-3 subunit beta
MKIICTQENLNQGLFVVSHLAAKNTSLPILNNILFQVSQDTIKLSATNLEIGVSCIIRGKVEEVGDFTVQSRLLADYVGLLPKEKVDLNAPKETKEGQDQILEVGCKNYATKIKGQPATDFPLIPQIEKGQPYTIKPENFREAISQVIFAVSINETRPEINGISFNFKDGKLILAATDSYRLAEKEIELTGQPDKTEKRIIVPTRTLQELLRILGSFKDPAAISNIEEVKIYLAENQILFVLNSI